MRELTREECASLFGLMMAECERQAAERREERRRRRDNLSVMAYEVSAEVMRDGRHHP